MWLEIIETGSPPEFTAKAKQSKSTLWKHLFLEHDGHRQSQVFSLCPSYYVNVCLMHSTLIFCPGLEQKKKEFLLLPYFPKGGGLINVAWLSGSAECVYSVVAGMC